MEISHMVFYFWQFATKSTPTATDRMHVRVCAQSEAGRVGVCEETKTEGKG